MQHLYSQHSYGEMGGGDRIVQKFKGPIAWNIHYRINKRNTASTKDKERTTLKSYPLSHAHIP